MENSAGEDGIEKALWGGGGAALALLCARVQTPPPSGEGALGRMEQSLWFPELAMKSVFSPAGWEDLLIWKVWVESHLSLRCQPVHISPKKV